MTLHSWLTHLPPAVGFLTAWEGTVRRARGAHFAFRPDYLEWQHQRAHASWAVLAAEDAREGALLLRPTPDGWACGQPWRCGAIVTRSEPGEGPIDLRREEGEWLFGIARGLAGGARLRMYLPFAPPRGVPGYVAGHSIHQDIQAADAELLQSMTSSKRQMVRRALRRGYAIRPAERPEEMRTFYTLERGMRRARGEQVADASGEACLPGTGWREWELPWMWLLLAVRDRRVESGASDSIGPGWSLEARTAASTAEARRDGAFALLCFEEARRAREAGLRWLNHGGDTVFKREIAGRLGRRVPMWCWLSGHPMWRLPNEAEAAIARVRHAIAQRRHPFLRRRFDVPG